MKTVKILGALFLMILLTAMSTTTAYADSKGLYSSEAAIETTVTVTETSVKTYTTDIDGNLYEVPPKNTTPPELMTTAKTAVTTIIPGAASAVPIETPSEDKLPTESEITSKLKEYLNEGEEVQTDGNSMLIDAEEISADKFMYTVATKDGSVFYIIVDLSSEGENVYFLNKVDTADLNAILEENKQEPVSPSEEVTTEITEAVTKETAEENTATEKKKSPITFIIIIILGVGVVAGYYFLKILPKKQAKNFEDPEDEEELTDPEPTINEDQEEENTR